ncbi:29310_t:CDS:2, partial [Racocetra persica]
MKLCEPVQVKSGEEISYFILIGPSHGIRGEFALDSTREKIDYFYQEITLDLFHPLSVLTAFYGSIESNDISKIISSSENKLCREKNYLVELLRKNPTEERELNEFLSKARAFERGTLGDESKRRIHERLSSEKLIKGRTIPEILDEPDEETLDPWKSEEEIETQRDEEDSGSKEDYYSGEEDRKDPEPDTRPLDEEEASSENTEDTEDHETPPPPKEENPLFD